ncbi:type II toxin-antitoxin system RelE family toxin [Alysiella filiformis]|uniref:mRNA interferase RelE/StbE n=1 Tax=Alysiella filiformis DSM 16848 TaxID=1120981 RepID=A0A286E7D1_9NEIS|nr:type II toxin-antitoxin system RelE/ParE family toxin [Alysiella filiformis]QMT31604.1 type II toxin-antitoxin system RelE/ParE family toxin [Alysiella filiformis]UBQ55385.1 type II toxin-antitoxin system RelE/ParE family toxin [Alysiella filiformis DSM 16848]SOD66828.1 mRNA interferase RelE/StbE [Alysiella filiformis DSM 16848]
MTYELEFNEKALEEFDKLSPDIAHQFVKKLEKILENPRIPKNKLRGANDLYKIKLRKSGFRLLYQVIDDRLVVLVIKIGRRDTVYNSLN